MKENGVMIKQMAMAFTLIPMVQLMKENGSTTCKMEKEQNDGLITHNFKVIIKMEKRRVEADICGMMEQSMMEIGLIMKLMVLADINGMMVEFILVIGKQML